MEKYFKRIRLDHNRPCSIMKNPSYNENGLLVFYDDCKRICEIIKKETEQKCEQSFIRSCPFYNEPDICDCIERTNDRCSKNEEECDNLKYYRNEYDKLDK